MQASVGTFCLAVGLSPTERGTHMSRFVEELDVLHGHLDRRVVLHDATIGRPANEPLRPYRRQVPVLPLAGCSASQRRLWRLRGKAVDGRNRWRR